VKRVSGEQLRALRLLAGLPTDVEVSILHCGDRG
jgi:hypothetical protein